MKKFFLFAAVAGMLASCSSESLTGSDPNIEPTQEERVPIEIGVATAQTKASTRGVGTVGGVTGGTNNWQGEKVNVFMFLEGSLTLATDGTNALYNNVALTTPNASTSGIAYEYYDSDATPGDDRVRYKYYPVTGNFDFWGYFIDDASGAAAAVPYADAAEYNAAKGTLLTDEEFAALPAENKIKTAAVEAVSIGENEVTVPFRIDGSQDLMVAKAEPTTAQQDIIDDDAFGTDKTRFYSAYAARRGVQPVMTFKHLLTRLTFSVLAGNDETRGFTASGPALPADGAIYTGVFVKSIKVRSLKAGEMIAAYTGAARELTDLISFTKSTDPTATAADSLWMDLPGERTGTTLAPLYDPAVFANAGTPAPWSTEYLAANKLLVIDADLSGENTHWNEIWRPKTLATAPATPNPDGDQIGGAILVAPDDSYIIEVELGQYLLDNNNLSGTDPVYKVAYTTFSKEITPTQVNGTTQGVSYNVKMTLYGFERIEITTTLQPWAPGAQIEFGVE